MGNCASRENVVAVAPVTSALLQPTPNPSVMRQLSFPSPRAGKRHEGGSLTREIFILDDLSEDKTDTNKPLIPVSPILFLSMIQRKSRKPIDYILLDLQPRSDHNRHTIKFSFSFWDSNAIADNANDKSKLDAVHKIRSQCAGKIILLFDSSDKPQESKNVLLFANLLSSSQISYKAAYLLEVSMTVFCKTYPHCHSKSPLSLPGPTEILWAANPAFCLYMGDIKTLKFNEKVLSDVHDIRLIINIAGDQGSTSQNPNISMEIITVPQTDCSNRGVWYAKIVEQLLTVAIRGLPTMVMDASGDRHAPAVCAFLLVSLGWSPTEVIKHIQLRRGPPKDDGTLFDAETIRALGKVAQNDKEGAIAEYSQWNDETLSLTTPNQKLTVQ